MYTIVLLSEVALNEHDAARVVALHEEDEVHVHLAVPADTEQNRLVAVLDDIALGEFREAVVERERVQPDEIARASARTAVDVSVARLTAAGAAAEGNVLSDDPVPSVVALVRTVHADEVIVMTMPHLVEDLLHRDWASRLRRELSVPVLHALAGTDRIVS